MDDRIRRGYARMLRDLQRFESQTRLKNALQSAKESIDEFERLIVKLEQNEDDPQDPTS